MIVVQMHGEPGSGKSTLAKALGRALPAVVLDKDVIKAELLSRFPGDDAAAGGIAYDVFFALAADVLAQGQSVILDSPVFWPSVEQRSLAVAQAAGAVYVMVECVCLDGGELARRLATRAALASQPREVHNWRAVPGTIDPSAERLVLDSLRPVDDLVEQALTYIRAGVPK